MSSGDPHHVLYRDFVRDPGHGYVTVEVPLDDGVVLSVAVP